MTRLNHSFSRRALLATVGTMATAPSIRTAHGRQGTPVSTPVPVSFAGASLRVLTTQHDVPTYDAVYEQLVQTWATAQGVTVTIDWVPTWDILAAVSNEVTLGQGHDLIDAPQPLPQFELAFTDLAELAETTAVISGSSLPAALETTFNPTSGKRWGLSYAYEPAVAIYRKTLWTEVGYEFGPASTEELLNGGAQIWNNRGLQLGIGLSPTTSSEVAMQSLLWAFGGGIQDAAELVTIDSPASLATVDFVRSLFEECATPVILEWTSGDNLRFMEHGFGSYTVDSLTGLRTLQTLEPEVAVDLFLAPPVSSGDRSIAGQFPAISHQIGSIPVWSTQSAAAGSLLQYLVAHTRLLTNVSQLALLPSFPETYPELLANDGPFANDPYGVLPPDKLRLMQNGGQWTAAPGRPGPSNALIATSGENFPLSRLMGSIASGMVDSATALAAAQLELEINANTWRELGLMPPVGTGGVG